MQELWKNIDGYDGKYQISNYGDIRATRDRYGRNKTTYIKGGVIKNGYRIVSLCKEGRYSTYYVHRLVAKYFCPNPFNDDCVNHIDGNKLNNRADNLEWLTREENIYHACRVGLIKVNNKNDYCKGNYKQINLFK